MNGSTDRSSTLLGSTYRLQLNGLGLARATALVPYLSALGVETLYCSPLTRAAPGSTHGYDVVDPTRIDPALGTTDDLRLLLEELAAHEMRLLIDIVPNHMATDRSNAWWWDVLRRGRESEFADYFDVDWSQHDGRVLLPTLAHPLSQVVRDDEPAVVESEGELVLSLDDQVLPLAPHTAVEPASLTELDTLDLMVRQHYLPADWHVGDDQINYRRFFDIDGLIGVRVEDSSVWRATHGLVLELLADERVAGVRVDHVDGLAAPGSYLERLRAEAQRVRGEAPVLLVEKILQHDEALPDWPVDGTTGYEFADLAGAVLVQQVPRGEPFSTLAVQAKRAELVAAFGSSIDRLVREAEHACDVTPGLASPDPSSIRHAVIELSTRLEVYRTYFDGTNDEEDVGRLQMASKQAAANLTSDGRLALAALVEGIVGGEDAWREFVVRWQQLTGAATAKGVEDTATYRADGPLGHAEVGSAPDRDPLSPAQFIDAIRQRYVDSPGSLNATSTHDAKRNEDVRARLYALTEWWPEWTAQVAQWRSEHAGWVIGHGGPDHHAMELAYQTLVAIWPTDATHLDEETGSRVEAYLLKAAREAKLRTSWRDPDEAYEATVAEAARFLARSPASGFGATARAWSERLAPAAATNSLALTLLKVICPGVPDIYQGNELVHYALTDPDNRRPIDFEQRRQMLESFDTQKTPGAPLLNELLASWPDGRLKLYVLRAALTLRRQHPEVFGTGSIEIPEISGSGSAHVVAIARRMNDVRVTAVVPRLTRSMLGGSGFVLGAAWGDTSLSFETELGPAPVDVLSERTLSAAPIQLADLLKDLPVALLLDHG